MRTKKRQREMEMERGHITQSENGILPVNNTKTKAIDLRPYVFIQD